MLIDPGVPVPASLREKSGRREEEYTGALPPAAALARIRGFIGRRVALAHEGNGLEASVLARFGALPAGPVLDTQELAWLAAPYLRDHSLASLAASLLGEPLSWRALEDARLLLRLLARLREAWEEAPRRTRAAVLGALTEVESPWRFLLAGTPSRSPFPDLTDMVPRMDDRQRDRAGGTAPGVRDREGRKRVDPAEAVSILAPGGALASVYPDHEARPQQAAMAEAVASAFNDAAFLVVEAGTGVGKSLAYLVPGVLFARAGGGPLVVSTFTRNLQEQLFHRDLPLLSRSLGSIDFALLKGRGNYLCLRKWAEWCGFLAHGEPVLHFGELKPGEAYAFLASWLTRTASGDLEEISLNLRCLLAELTAELSSSSEDCLRAHCRFNERCWVERARAQAARSEVVVVNHALVLSQICVAEPEPSKLVLPDYRTLVVDEAHHLEDVATEALSLAFRLDDLLRALDEVASRRGLLSRWKRLALDAKGRGTLSETDELAEGVRAGAEELCLRILDPLLPRLPAAEREEARYRLDHRMLADPAWELAREKGLGLADDLSRLASLLSGLAEKALTSGGGGEASQADARRGDALAARAREEGAALRVFFADPSGPEFRRHLRWLERAPARHRGSVAPAFCLQSAPVSVGEELSTLLFSRLDAAVFTSASLRVPGGREGFSFFLRRSGLDLAEGGGKELRLLALDSPFDYSCQVRLIAVTDLPEPSADKDAFQHYMQEIGGLLERVLVATGGKALVLLTSHQQVDLLYKQLRPRLEGQGLCCLRQRRGEPNALLLERFREDRDSVLLATEAFWEGVDVPGESLSVVIMVKLPFRHPEDPVVAGRMEHYDAEGSGGWGSYYVPLAVTLFRQGIRRLVRRSTDQGVILVLDPRFLTRSYSRCFHAALPPGLRVETASKHELGSGLVF